MEWNACIERKINEWATAHRDGGRPQCN